MFKVVLVMFVIAVAAAVGVWFSADGWVKQTLQFITAMDVMVLLVTVLLAVLQKLSDSMTT